MAYQEKFDPLRIGAGYTHEYGARRMSRCLDKAFEDEECYAGSHVEPNCLSNFLDYDVTIFLVNEEGKRFTPCIGDWKESRKEKKEMIKEARETIEDWKSQYLS